MLTRASSAVLGRRAPRLSVVAILALVALPSHVWAWGCEGHQTVALIAQAHLKGTAAGTKVTAILKNPHIDPKLPRFCNNAKIARIASVATWADDVRGARPETAEWHFLDIPRNATDTNLSPFCGTAGCVTTAIAQQVEILKHGTDPTKRAEALMFIIHFVGDIHQPLHCATNNDRGGNCIPTDFFGRRTARKRDPNGQLLKTEDYTPNLHAVWDTNIIQHRMGPNTTVTQYAQQLDTQFQARVASWESAGIDLEAWARESHALADSVAYDKLPTAIAVETPQPPIKHCSDNNHVAKRLAKLHEALGNDYQNAAVPVIEEQLAKAGVRLALILRDVWP
jgi:hypothetical protein